MYIFNFLHNSILSSSSEVSYDPGKMSFRSLVFLPVRLNSHPRGRVPSEIRCRKKRRRRGGVQERSHEPLLGLPAGSHVPPVIHFGRPRKFPSYFSPKRRRRSLAPSPDDRLKGSPERGNR